MCITLLIMNVLDEEQVNNEIRPELAYFYDPRSLQLYAVLYRFKHMLWFDVVCFLKVGNSLGNFDDAMVTAW